MPCPTQARLGVPLRDPEHSTLKGLVPDSNVVIAALNGDRRARSKLASIRPDSIRIPILVLGELLYGAYRPRRRTENLERIARLRETFAVLPVSEEVVGLYARTRANWSRAVSARRTSTS
jgi:predicted nucleic acid-binding protein